MIRLAAPVVLAELGWMTMGIVDTLMVGRLSPEAIGAVGVGSSLFISVAIFAMGLMLGLDALVSRAYGAGDLEDCHRWLMHAVALALAASPVFMLMLFGLAGLLERWGLTPTVLELTRPYLNARDVELAAAAVVRGVPPLPAGDGVRPADHGGARQREHRQRGLQLDSRFTAISGRPRWACADRHGRRCSHAA